MTPETRPALLPSLSDIGEDSPRECDCPEWVIRCAHFADKRLVLGTGHPEAWAYAVTILGASAFCTCCNPAQVVWDPVGELFYHGLSLTDAHAAFERAEADLLAAPA